MNTFYRFIICIILSLSTNPIQSASTQSSTAAWTNQQINTFTIALENFIKTLQPMVGTDQAWTTDLNLQAYNFMLQRNTMRNNENNFDPYLDYAITQSYINTRTYMKNWIDKAFNVLMAMRDMIINKKPMDNATLLLLADLDTEDQSIQEFNRYS